MSDQLDALKAKQIELAGKIARYEKLMAEATTELAKVEAAVKEITEGRDLEAYRQAKAEVEKNKLNLSADEFFKLVASKREAIELSFASQKKKGRPRKLVD